jgi:hypothetical protein
MAKGLQRHAMQTKIGMGAEAVRHAASVARRVAFKSAEGVRPAVVQEVA